MNIDSNSEDTKDDTDQIQQLIEAIKLQNSPLRSNRLAGKIMLIEFTNNLTCNDCIKLLSKCVDKNTTYEALHIMSNLIIKYLADMNQIKTVFHALMVYATKNVNLLVSEFSVLRVLAKCFAILFTSMYITTHPRNLSAITQVIKTLIQADPRFKMLVLNILEQIIQYCTVLTANDISFLLQTTLQMFIWEHITESSTNIAAPINFELKELSKVIHIITKLLSYPLEDNIGQKCSQQCLSLFAECHSYLYTNFRYNAYVQSILSTLRKFITRIFASLNTKELSSAYSHSSRLGGATADSDLKTKETDDIYSGLHGRLNCFELCCTVFQRHILNLIIYDDVDEPLLSDICVMINTIFHSFGLEMLECTSKQKQFVKELWDHVSSVVTFLTRTHKHEVFHDNDWKMVTNALYSLQQQYETFVKTRQQYETFVKTIEAVLANVWMKNFKIVVNSLLNAAEELQTTFNKPKHTEYINLFQGLKTFGKISKFNHENYTVLKDAINNVFKVIKQHIVQRTDTSPKYISIAQNKLICLFLLCRFVDFDHNKLKEIHSYLTQWLQLQCKLRDDGNICTVVSPTLTQIVCETECVLARSKHILWGVKVDIGQSLLKQVNNEMNLKIMQNKCHGFENDAKSENNNCFLGLEQRIHSLESFIEYDNSSQKMSTLECLRNCDSYKLLLKNYQNVLSSTTSAQEIGGKVISLLTVIMLKIHKNAKGRQHYFVSNMLQQLHQKTDLTYYTVLGKGEGVIEQWLAVLYGLSTDNDGVDMFINASIGADLMLLVNYYCDSNKQEKLLYLLEIVCNVASTTLSLLSTLRMPGVLSIYSLVSGLIHAIVQNKCNLSDDVCIQMLSLAKVQVKMVTVDTKKHMQSNYSTMFEFLQMLLPNIDGKKCELVIEFWQFMLHFVGRNLLAPSNIILLKEGELNLLNMVIGKSLRSKYGTVQDIGRTIAEHIAKLKTVHLKLRKHLLMSIQLLMDMLIGKETTDWQHKAISKTFLLCLLDMNYNAREHFMHNTVQKYIVDEYITQAKNSVVSLNDVLKN
eukprot:535289_1